MRLMAFGAGAVAASISAAVISKTVNDDHNLPMRSVERGQLQHGMFAEGGIAGLAAISTIAMAIAHTTGRLGAADAFAGAAIGLTAGLLGSLAGARLLRSPDSNVPKMERI